jgi:hypothetical protein
MKRALSLPFASLALLGLTVAGASLLVLKGSDSAPYEHKFVSAECAQGIVETPLVAEQGNAYKVYEVIISGDFNECAGAQMLVTAQLSKNKSVWAVVNLSTRSHVIHVRFDSGQESGDFRQKFPEIIGVRLVPTGPSTPAPNELSPTDVTLTYGWSWQS